MLRVKKFIKLFEISRLPNFIHKLMFVFTLRIFSRGGRGGGGGGVVGSYILSQVFDKPEIYLITLLVNII